MHEILQYLVLSHFLFLNDFDSTVYACFNMFCPLYFAKRSLSESSIKSVVLFDILDFLESLEIFEWENPSNLFLI